MLKQFFEISHLNKLPLFLVGVGFLGMSAAYAGDLKPFDESLFTKAQKDQKTIVLDYHADWCPTCRKQKPALIEALHSKGFENVIGFEVNFDEQPASLKKTLNVTQQSTLIVYRGKEVKGRDSGVTNTSDIKRLIEKGL